MPDSEGVPYILLLENSLNMSYMEPIQSKVLCFLLNKRQISSIALFDTLDMKMCLEV